MRVRDGFVGLIATAVAATAAQGAVIRVGSGGDVATIQAGIDAAQATPENDQLRVRAGTWNENLLVSGADLGGTLEITGGWNASWTDRDPDPASTVIDGGGAGRAFEAGFVSAGALVLRGLSFEGGRAQSGSSGGARGAGLFVLAFDVPVAVENCLFRLNEVQASNGISGAGAAGGYVIVGGTASLSIDGLVASNNSTTLNDTIGAVVGAGFGIVSQGSATVTVAHARFEANTMAGPGQQRGAGLALEASSSSTISMADSVFVGNHGSGMTNGAALAASLSDDGSIDLRRLVASENRRDASDPSEQMYVRCFAPGDCSVRISDSLIADGGTGIMIDSPSGVIDLVNVTSTAHSQLGISGQVFPPGVGSLGNSIAWANAGGDVLLFGSGITQQANLIGVDPRFVSPASGNYRPGADSPARDAGTATPSGGLSALALGGEPRLAGSAPDQGAYELGEIFVDGFESGDTLAWSLSVP